MFAVKNAWLVVCLSVCIVQVTSNVVFQKRQDAPKPGFNHGHSNLNDAVRVFAKENLSNVGSDESPQDSDQYGMGINDSLVNLVNPDWNSILYNLVNSFRPNSHALHKGYQFGVLYMGHLNEANEKDYANHLHLVPVDAQGHPVIDDNVPLSPSRSEYASYVYSRPRDVSNSGRFIHCERQLINERNYLQPAFHNQFKLHPNLVIMYSYIMPCSDCTNEIITQYNYIKDRYPYRVVGYTSEGLHLKYMTEEKNKQNRNKLTGNNIKVFHVNLAPRDKGSSSPDDFGYEIEKKTGNTWLKNMKHGEYNPDPYISPLQETFQGCMMYCLESDLCCSCTEGGKKSMTAALINELTKACALTDINACAYKWIRSALTQDIRGGASNCTDPNIVASNINVCASKCSDRPFSKPLNLKGPDIYPGRLANFTDLPDLPDVDLTEFCEDLRAEGLLCTLWRSDSLTAGNTHCRSHNRCGYHGYKYSWCFVDWSNHWDYCCTGDCGFGQETDYMWCRSGNKWQYCNV